MGLYDMIWQDKSNGELVEAIGVKSGKDELLIGTSIGEDMMKVVVGYWAIPSPKCFVGKGGVTFEVVL
jgi:hypothetical protein